MTTKEFIDKVIELSLSESVDKFTYEYKDGNKIVINLNDNEMMYSIERIKEIYDVAISQGFDENTAIKACADIVTNGIKNQLVK